VIVWWPALLIDFASDPPLLAYVQYSSDLNRCGAPEYYGASGPEPSTDLDKGGNPRYWRAQYPGQPFRKNVHVCITRRAHCDCIDMRIDAFLGAGS
jgi:hypothetical protein